MSKRLRQKLPKSRLNRLLPVRSLLPLAEETVLAVSARAVAV